MPPPPLGGLARPARPSGRGCGLQIQTYTFESRRYRLDLARPYLHVPVEQAARSGGGVEDACLEQRRGQRPGGLPGARRGVGGAGGGGRTGEASCSCVRVCMEGGGGVHRAAAKSEAEAPHKKDARKGRLIPPPGLSPTPTPTLRLLGHGPRSGMARDYRDLCTHPPIRPPAAAPAARTRR